MEERSTRYRERNNKSVKDNMDFVRKEVKRLLDGGQIIKVDKPPMVINPLSVAYKINADGTEKPRLVIDL
jgi:methionine synthase II (cobalamin-independent)